MLSLRTTLAKHRPLRASYHKARDFATARLYKVSPELLARLRYRLAWGKWPDLDRPRRFDEKLLWLMLYDRDPMYARCGDKLAMRAYAEECGLPQVLNRMHGVYKDPDDIDFGALPERFVLKCTHGCKCNIFCDTKSSLDVVSAKRDLRRWLRTDYSTMHGEVHYADMSPRIICVDYHEGEAGERFPDDYKILCFNGRAHCTMVCTQRDANGTPKLDFYDREWKRVLPYATPDIKLGRLAQMPSAYKEMIEVAERLAAPFPFVRVDLYNIKGRAVLGEMTFTPGACVSEDYLTEEAQEDLGRMLQLPAERSARATPEALAGPRDRRGSGSILNAVTRELYMPLCRAYARRFVRDKPADSLFCLLVAIHFWKVHRYWPDFRNPRSFEEKINSRMLFDRHPKWTTLSDKLSARQFVESRIGAGHQAALLWAGSDPERIPFGELPSQFVIKASHGCGFNIIVMDKAAMDVATARAQLRRWLSVNFGADVWTGIQWGYRNIKPRILVEEFLSDGGAVPLDYKFFVFSGRAEYIQVNIDRHGDPYEKFLTRDFDPLNLWQGTRQFPHRIERPANLEEMLRIAEALGSGFDFLRVDMYALGARIYVGELTCYPSAGSTYFEPRLYDFVWGEKWAMSPQNGRAEPVHA